MKIKMAVELELASMETEIQKYKEIAAKKTLQPIGEALLELADCAEKNLPGLIHLYTQKKKICGTGRHADDRLGDFIGDGLHRRLMLSSALCLEGSPHFFQELVSALRSDAVSPLNYTTEIKSLVFENTGAGATNG